MASKLFRAVVGFGIGLGATTAACFGASEGGTVGGDLSGWDASTSTKAPPSGESTYSNTDPDPDPDPVTADGLPDAKVVADAGLDAPKDVGVDAFCDAAWPTTKGNPKPPSCVDPNNECADAGPNHRCVPLDDAGACDWSVFETTAAFCINEEWRCQSGTVDWGSCQ